MGTTKLPKCGTSPAESARTHSLDTPRTWCRQFSLLMAPQLSQLLSTKLPKCGTSPAESARAHFLDTPITCVRQFSLLMAPKLSQLLSSSTFFDHWPYARTRWQDPFTGTGLVRGVSVFLSEE